MSTTAPFNQPQPIGKFERGSEHGAERHGGVVEPAASKPAFTRFLFPLLWAIIGILTIVQLALVGHQVATSNRPLSNSRFSNEWYDRLCYMLFVASWTLFFFVLHWAYNIYITVLYTFMTWIFWIVAASLWQLIYNGVNDGVCTLRRCSRLAAVNVIAWILVAFTTLLMLTVLAHWALDRRGRTFHKRGVRNVYWW